MPAPRPQTRERDHGGRGARGHRLRHLPRPRRHPVHPARTRQRKPRLHGARTPRRRACRRPLRRLLLGWDRRPCGDRPQRLLGPAAPASLREIIASAPELSPGLADCLLRTLDPDPTAQPAPRSLLERLAALEPGRGADRFLDLELTSRATQAWTVERLVLPDGEVLEVPVPPGTGHGDRITLSGLGAPGVHAGPPGDLHLKVSIRPFHVPEEAETHAPTSRHGFSARATRLTLVAFGVFGAAVGFLVWPFLEPLVAETPANTVKEPTSAAAALLEVRFGSPACPDDTISVVVSNETESGQAYLITRDGETVVTDWLDPKGSRTSKVTLTEDKRIAVEVVRNDWPLSSRTYRLNCID